MANKKTTTVEDATVVAQSNKAVAEAEKDRKELARTFKAQTTVPVAIPPLYKPYFGKVMVVTLNGVSVAVPCDGKTYQIPQAFANEIAVRLDNQNELIERKNRLGNVQNNFESSPGSLNLF